MRSRLVAGDARARGLDVKGGARRAGLGRAALVALLCAAPLGLGTCSQETIVLPSRDFDRPTDMAFSCVHVWKDTMTLEYRVEAQPMGRCHPPGVQDPKPNENPDDRYVTIGYVTNSERGSVSVVNLSYCRDNDSRCFPQGATIMDLDPATVGFDGPPVGKLPETVAASQDGCRVLTANRGSCDLTMIRPAGLLARKLVPASAASGQVELSQYGKTIVPTTASGQPLNVAPSEVAFLPQQTRALSMEGDWFADDPAARPAAVEDTCDFGPTNNPFESEGTLAAPVGAPAASVANPATWRALVTFPSCDLIALLDVPSGQIKDSWRIQASTDGSAPTFVHSGSEPQCPRPDCGERAPLGDDQLTCATPMEAMLPMSTSPLPLTAALFAQTGSAGAGGAGGEAGAGGAGGEAGAGGAAGGAGGTVTADAGTEVDAAIVDAGAGGSAATDAAATDGGAGGTSGPGNLNPACTMGLAALALDPRGRRVYVGAPKSPFVAALDVTPDTLTLPAAGATTELHAGAAGVLRLRLSVDPFDFSDAVYADTAKADLVEAEYGRFVVGPSRAPDDRREYLYAIARDGSLRVVDVVPDAPTECDLAIDPTDPAAGAVGETPTPPVRCFPYGAADNPRHRPYVPGPGLRFPSPPQDIAFADDTTPFLTETDLTNRPRNEAMLNGAFGFVMTVNGALFVVNVDPELRETSQIVVPDLNDESVFTTERVKESPRPLANSLRNANVVTFSSVLSATSGPARLDTPPLTTTTGPTLWSFKTLSSVYNPLAVPGTDAKLSLPPNPTPLDTYVFIPDPTGVVPQGWTVAWEGDLVATRLTGVVSHAQVDESDPTRKLQDFGIGFCNAGVLPGDIATLTGCTEDASCGPGQICVQSPRVPEKVANLPITGLCLPRDHATEYRDGMCRAALETFRRYEVVHSSNNTLNLVPKLVEMPRPVLPAAAGAPLMNCNPDASDQKECNPTDQTTTTGFTCERVDDLMAAGFLPAAGPVTRCLVPCAADADCRAGEVCGTFGDKMFCAEAPPLDPGCYEELSAFKVSAGRSFLVSGGSSGRIEGFKQGEVDCEVDAERLAASPLQVGRIRLDTPTCSEFPTPINYGDVPKTFRTALIQSDTSKVNPCFARSHLKPPGPDGMESPELAVNAIFQNTQMRFIVRDLQIPISSGYQIRFEVHGGFRALQATLSSDASLGLPKRLMLGPISSVEQLMPGAFEVELTEDADTEAMDSRPKVIPDCAHGIACSSLPYLFVVDQRQVTSGTTLGARGQVLRINPRNPDVPGLEGFTASNRYFPIQ